MLYFSALKILLHTEEDKLALIKNNGLMCLADVRIFSFNERAHTRANHHVEEFLFRSSHKICDRLQAFTTLHLMYHEATACHVTGDLIELLSVILDIFNCCRSNMNAQGTFDCIYLPFFLIDVE